MATPKIGPLYRETFLDLLTIAAFAPGDDASYPEGFRAAAEKLLAAELVARLENTDRDWSIGKGGTPHRAFQVFEHPALARGYRSTAFYLWYGRSGLGWGVSVPKVPKGLYFFQLDIVIASAALLKTAAIASWGSGNFNTQRAIFSDYLDAAETLEKTLPGDAGYATALSTWQTEKLAVKSALAPLG